MLKIKQKNGNKLLIDVEKKNWTQFDKIKTENYLFREINLKAKKKKFDFIKSWVTNRDMQKTKLHHYVNKIRHRKKYAKN